MIAKGLIFAALSVALVAIATSPKLRAGSRMGYLMATHGVPYRVFDMFFRLPALSNVNANTCSKNPTGRAACYVVDPSEFKANMKAYHHHLSKVEHEHIMFWHDALKDGEGNVDLSMMIEEMLGASVGSGLTNVNLHLDGFKAMFGAGIRSIIDKGISEKDLRPIFAYLDKDNNKKLSVNERIASMTMDCNDQSSRSYECAAYIEFVKALIPQREESFAQFAEDFLTEGASLQELLTE